MNVGARHGRVRDDARRGTRRQWLDLTAFTLPLQAVMDDVLDGRVVAILVVVLLALDAWYEWVGVGTPGLLADFTDLALVASENCSHGEASAFA